MKKNLLTPRSYYKPFEFPFAYEAYKEQSKMHWIPDEVPLGEDVKDWNKKLTEQEKNLLTQLFRFFTDADVSIAQGYLHKYIPIFGHKPEMAMMLATFAASEAVHQDAYSLLLDTVGMPEAEYKAFSKYEAMKAKHDYLDNVTISHLGEFATPEEAHQRLKDIAKSLAIYSAFSEGLQLFSSFAMLLSFPRANKMKGMGQIVSWSVRDECYSDDTEILTNTGWKLFQDLIPADKVAQYDSDNGEISFVKPSRYIKKHKHEKLIHFYQEKGGIDLLVTQNHDILYQYHGAATKSGLKAKAKDFKGQYRNKLILAGTKITGETLLTPEERILIALQADGNIPSAANRTGERCGHRKVCFQLKKERKITRLLKLLNSSEFEWQQSKSSKEGFTTIYVDIPITYPITKKFSEWVNLEEVNSQWASEFIEEVLNWDGNDKEGDGSVIYYSSVEKSNVDILQALCTLCNRKSSYFIQKDDRKETYRDVHRILIWKQDVTPTGSLLKEEVDYDGYVYCVTVPKGNVIVRRNNRVVVSGNSLHCKSMIQLFREFIKENKEIWTDDFKAEIYQACRDMVELEDNFIDLAFECGNIDGLTKEDTKLFVRHIADRRLLQLGLKANYKVKDNPLPWFDDMIGGVEHANFFEARSTAYSKGSVNGSFI